MRVLCDLHASIFISILYLVSLSFSIVRNSKKKFVSDCKPQAVLCIDVDDLKEDKEEKEKEGKEEIGKEDKEEKEKEDEG